MVKYKKVYSDYHDYYETELIFCEVCNRVAVDIHHIKFKSQGGKDVIENLAALCRDCHNKAHADKEFNKKLQLRKNIEFNR